MAQCQPEHEDAAAAAALANEAFCRQMVGLGEQNAPISQEIWEQAYLLTSLWARLFVQHSLLDQPRPEQDRGQPGARMGASPHKVEVPVAGVAVLRWPLSSLNLKSNIYHCFLRDPNGYLIEIQRFLGPAWPREATGRSPRDWAT